MKKRMSLGLLLVWLMGCSSHSDDSILLLNLNSQFRSTLNQVEAREKMEVLNKTLDELVHINSAPNVKNWNSFNRYRYTQESFEQIQKVVMDLGLKMEYLNGENILIHPNITPNDLAENLIFLVQLDNSNLYNEQNPEQIRELVGWDNGTYYGYQSLYPKGFLTSLLWALSDFSKMDDVQRKHVQIWVTRNQESIKNVQSRIKSLFPDNQELLILPVLEYPGVSAMTGEVEWSLDLPQDTDWLVDLTTSVLDDKKVVHLKYHLVEENKRTEKTESFVLSPTLEGFAHDPDLEITQNIQKIGSFFVHLMDEPHPNINLSYSRNQTFLTLMKFLRNFPKSFVFTGEDGKPIELEHIQLTELKTTSRRVQLFFKANSLGENQQLFRSAFYTFVKEKMFAIPSNTRENNAYTFNLSHYQPSYSIHNQLKTQQYYPLLQSSYKKAYSQKVSPQLTAHYNVLTDIVPNTLFMGTVFQVPSYYYGMHFVPEGKLFLDYQFIMYFLSSRVEN